MAEDCTKCTKKRKENPTLLTILENDFCASYNYRRCQNVATFRIKFCRHYFRRVLWPEKILHKITKMEVRL